ncbi:MAG: hypothetical protein MPJ24_08100 [Pirellulaceae bacterium]|nr:hypothetical protein [Pirellulaceae bacterium]
MARKVVSKKKLREEADAAAEEAPVRKKRKVKRKVKRKTKRKSKAAAAVRMKLFWGVFSQSMKRVALFEFDQQKEAEKKAEDLNKSGKSPHFVQKVKEEVVVEEPEVDETPQEGS